MELLFDSRGNGYIQISGFRITYLEADRRTDEANWTGGHNTLRFQRVGPEGRVYPGAEFPISGDSNPWDLIAAIACLLREA